MLVAQRFEQLRVVDVDAGLVLGGEQVAGDGAACGLVLGDADELRRRRSAVQLVVEKRRADRARVDVIVALYRLETRQLRLGVCRHGEGRQGLQRQLLGPVGLQQVGVDGRQPQPLLDGHGRHPEPLGDGLDGVPGLVQLAEGFHLVGGVHVGPDYVLGKADLGDLLLLPHDETGDGVGVAVDLALAGQPLEGLKAPAPRDHAVRVVGLRIPGEQHLQVLADAVRVDGRFQLIVLLLGRRRRADVGFAQIQLPERDCFDVGYGHGSISSSQSR